MKVLDSRLQGLWDDAQQLAMGIDLIGAIALAELPGEALAELPDEEQARGLNDQVHLLEARLAKSFPGLTGCQRHVRVWADGDGFPEFATGYVWRVRIWVEKPPEELAAVEETNAEALDVWARGKSFTRTAHRCPPEKIRLVGPGSAQCMGCNEVRELETS